ncbi:MAG: S41 family peptidase [Blastocatellia bacterium]
MKKLILMVVVCALAGLQTLAQTQSGEATIAASRQAPAEAADPRRRSFDIVWRTVREKHFDPALGGVDWDAVRRKYEPLVARAGKDRDFYRLLNEMLGELRQSHFGVIPPEAILADGSLDAPVGEIGVDLRIVESRAVITRVAPGSAAERAGLRPGFAIERIDGMDVAKRRKELMVKLSRISLTREMNTGLKNFTVAQVLRYRMGGKPGTPARLEVLDERNRTRRVTAEREKVAGEMAAAVGNLPAARLDFEARRLAGGAGYVRFNGFLMPVMAKVRAAMREFHDAPGIIFDLRGNGGGLGGLAPGIIGLMESRQTSIGVTRMRAGHQNLVAFPQPNPYRGRVAVLVDAGCASTCEIFAAGLQDLGRAVVIGESSAGMALPSMFEKLPTGAIFQYVFADFKTAKGLLLEGRGVTPDVTLAPTRESLLTGRDPLIEAALDRISTARN